MVKKVLISQPRPAVLEKSPFYELSTKHKVEVDYKPLIRVVGVTLKEFRSQRIEILDHTAVIFLPLLLFLCRRKAVGAQHSWPHTWQENNADG